eukprot:81677-Hanusia_phi.AAC.1
MANSDEGVLPGWKRGRDEGDGSSVHDPFDAVCELSRLSDQELSRHTKLAVQRILVDFKEHGRVVEMALRCLKRLFATGSLLLNFEERIEFANSVLDALKKCDAPSKTLISTELEEVADIAELMCEWKTWNKMNDLGVSALLSIIRPQDIVKCSKAFQMSVYGRIVRMSDALTTLPTIIEEVKDDNLNASLIGEHLQGLIALYCKMMTNVLLMKSRLPEVAKLKELIRFLANKFTTTYTMVDEEMTSQVLGALHILLRSCSQSQKDLASAAATERQLGGVDFFPVDICFHIQQLKIAKSKHKFQRLSEQKIALERQFKKANIKLVKSQRKNRRLVRQHAREKAELESRLQEGKEKLDGLREACMLCKDRPMRQVVLPCGHGVTCENCVLDVVMCPNCPYCREPIEQVKR